jgi:hypothetical protein
MGGSGSYGAGAGGGCSGVQRSGQFLIVAGGGGGGSSTTTQAGGSGGWPTFVFFSLLFVLYISHIHRLFLEEPKAKDLVLVEEIQELNQLLALEELRPDPTVSCHLASLSPARGFTTIHSLQVILVSVLLAETALSVYPMLGEGAAEVCLVVVVVQEQAEEEVCCCSLAFVFIS